MHNSVLNSAVGQGLEQLGLGLRPIVERGFAEALPGVEWTRIIEATDRAAGIGHDQYLASDVSLMLRAMTEKIGELGYPFDRLLSRSARGYVSELQNVRTGQAHNEGLTEQDAYRALDSMQLLLEIVKAEGEARVVGEIKERVFGGSQEADRSSGSEDEMDELGALGVVSEGAELSVAESTVGEEAPLGGGAELDEESLADAAPPRSLRVREWSERLASLETLSEFHNRKARSADA